MVQVIDNPLVPNGIDLYLIFSDLIEGSGRSGNMLASLLSAKSYYLGFLLSGSKINDVIKDKPSNNDAESKLKNNIRSLITDDLFIPTISFISPYQMDLYTSWINREFRLPIMKKSDYCEDIDHKTRNIMNRKCHIFAYRTVYQNSFLTYEQWNDAKNSDEELAELVYCVARIIRGIDFYLKLVSNKKIFSIDFSKLKRLLVDYAHMDQKEKGVGGEKFKRMVEYFKKLELRRTNLVNKAFKGLGINY
ncbi:hypothetical protein AYI70_g10243 [Smittium culicis]|uniref:Uncharacterized protein n=1 Tax=Smittium culicis TaxID=133412 RepID=A0A1R1X7H1_9FUNG|nr:hypothetical protein AYI70_g10243 [Smittium culicis]